MALYLGTQLVAGDGSAADISVDQVLKSGEHIATFSVDGLSTKLYAPQQTECAMAGKADSLSADVLGISAGVLGVSADVLGVSAGVLGISADVEELKESVA